MQVHKPGIATALARLDAEGLTNVKIAAGDAVKALMDHVRDRSLDECCVFFPDPFPKDHESDRCGARCQLSTRPRGTTCISVFAVGRVF